MPGLGAENGEMGGHSRFPEPPLMPPTTMIIVLSLPYLSDSKTISEYYLLARARVATAPQLRGSVSRIFSTAIPAPEIVATHCAASCISGRSAHMPNPIGSGELRLGLGQVGGETPLEQRLQGDPEGLGEVLQLGNASSETVAAALSSCPPALRHVTRSNLRFRARAPPEITGIPRQHDQTPRQHDRRDPEIHRPHSEPLRDQRRKDRRRRVIKWEHGAMVVAQDLRQQAI